MDKGNANGDGLPVEFVSSTLTLITKPTAPIHYAFCPPSVVNSNAKDTLLIFINGLGLPMAGWHQSVSLLISDLRNSGTKTPAMLLYDRFGQGQTTSRDPYDKGKEEGYGHNAKDIFHDLDDIIHFTLHKYFDGGLESLPHIIFVAHSIGCPIARLYLQTHPGIVGGLILLDSNIANNDQLNDVWPDPDSSDFDAATALPENVSVTDLRRAREVYARMFHPSVKNAESFDRRDLAALLPFADRPLLVGPNGKGPLLTVVGHDPEEFARQSEMSPFLGTPPALTHRYPNAVWHRYNEGLLKISSRANELVIAKGCGHFVQKDDPSLVARVILAMLEQLEE